MLRQLLRCGTCGFLVFGFVQVSQSVSAERYYVDFDAGSDTMNTGTGAWANAFKTLQRALQEVEPTDEIWVAASTNPYVPSIPDDPNDDSNVAIGSYGLNCNDDATRTKTFLLVKNVSIYGGFLGNAPGGGETDKSQADPINNVTVLSGNLGEEGNAYHVVRYYQDTTLDAILPNPALMVVDGFTITGGVADGGVTVGPCTGGDLNSVGGGALTVILPEGTGIASPPGPRFSRCKFVRNSATYGGAAVAGVFTGCYIVDCDFIENEQTGTTESLFISGELEHGGGAVGVTGPVLLLSSRFNRNVADNSGGGFQHSVARTNDTFLISNCEFRQNYTGGSGYDSGLYLGGGAVATASNGTLHAVNCKFVDNHREEEHGGAISDALTTSKIVNCQFFGNSAPSGGGLFTRNIVVNCLFAGNKATDGGGGAIFCGSRDGLTLLDCTFVTASDDVASALRGATTSHDRRGVDTSKLGVEVFVRSLTVTARCGR